jgi:hypothetical protein
MVQARRGLSDERDKTIVIAGSGIVGRYATPGLTPKAISAGLRSA